MIQPPTYEMIGNNMVLLEDTIFEKDLILQGDIYCKNGSHALAVFGDVTAKNITVDNIEAKNIKAEDIDAENIDAVHIEADMIDAKNITVEGMDVIEIIWKRTD